MLTGRFSVAVGTCFDALNDGCAYAVPLPSAAAAAAITSKLAEPEAPVLVETA